MNRMRENLGSPSNGGLTRGISSLSADVTTLTVLQARLAACDLRDEIRRVGTPIVVLGVCGMITAAGVFAIVLGASYWLSAALGVTLGAAMMLSGLAAALIGAAVAFLCVRKIASGGPVFRRSHEELERNLAWIRTTLARNGRRP